jgi:Kef-type K+ transport system membrane component KefB
LGGLFRKLGQAPVVGELCAGVLVGPSGLGALAPDFFHAIFPAGQTQTLGSMAWLGSVLLLLAAGMEVDLKILGKKRRAISTTSLLAIALPFALGLLFGAVLPESYLVEPSRRWIFALFLATALSISAIPLVAKLLMDLDLLKLAVGQVILGAAVVNDIIGWLLFAVILSLMTGGVAWNGSIFGVIAIIVAAAALSVTLGRSLMMRVFSGFHALGIEREGILGVAVLTAFLFAAFTQWIGIHAVFGAFLAGVMIGATGEIRNHLHESLRNFVFYLFAPIFFASMGFRVNFVANFDGLVVLAMVVLACAGKAAGAASGAFLGGMRRTDALTIGFGLMPTGAMGLILAFLALENGLITETIFVGLTAVALVTSGLSGPLIQWVRANDSAGNRKI